MPTEPKYWPFPVPQSAQHENEVRFLDEAYQAGFRPRTFLHREYAAHVEAGRYGWIVYRGRTRKDGPTCWELWLDDPSGRVVACWVDDFDTAAASVLAWLRGHDPLAIVEAAKPHVIKGPKVTVSQQVAGSSE